MKPSTKFIKVAGLVSILILPATFLLLFSTAKHQFLKLPIYGEKVAVEKNVNGEIIVDTLYHTIQPWSFTNQHGKTLSDKDYRGKIYIADFFFTKCPSICPKMSGQMVRLQWKLKDKAYDDVLLLSHTVDPENDSAKALLDYAELRDADFKKWNFVTGNKRDLYEMGVSSYLLATREDVMAPGGFLHSEKFVLIDRKGRIRGFYDGTNTEEVDRLIDEVKLLLKEEKVEAKELKEKQLKSEA